MKCGNCGSVNISKIPMKGKSFPWKDFPSVLISIDEISLNACTNCGEIQLSSRQNEAEKLDKVLQDSIQHQVGIFIEVIDREGKVSQKEICEYIGVPTQHLSKVKNGLEKPSFQLYTFLKLLAEDPK